ncbi:MAG TPA: hypothetical protein VLU24_08435 [Mycobacterium sp.]|nr:hypothetical protein [Mycobacterium sp.]
MSDADREWTIEHAGEQLYDIISSLDYDETKFEISLEAGERIRAALTPAGWRLIGCGD